VAIGDATATGVVLGVVTTSDEAEHTTRGIMGIGFEGLEGSAIKYPTLLDDLYDQGIISSHSYGIHLDQLGKYFGQDNRHVADRSQILAPAPSFSADTIRLCSLATSSHSRLSPMWTMPLVFR
jgi:Eukaryotic aspartyl protease